MTTIRTTQSSPDAATIDLGIGQPGPDLLPLALLREATAMRLAGDDATLLSYGYELGDGYFRRALGAFLTAHYGFALDPESLMVTTGSSQGLDLICSCFTEPGDTVFVGEPTYFLALRIFADRHLRVVGLPVDEQGIVIEALEERLAAERPALLYLVPTFQNPSGATLPAERRAKLVALAEAFDFLIVADEVYQLLSYTVLPPPPLAHYDNGGRVLSVGSFSKILAPGLRLGWIQATPVQLQRIAGSGLLDSGGGLNPFTSNLVKVVLEKGWQDDYLNGLKEVYGRRVEAMATALRRELGAAADFNVPHGGFFFWVRLAPSVDTERLLPRAQAQGVGFKPGIHFSSRGALRNYMRLCFAYYDEATIATGVARLGSVFGNGV
jgi:DNA-binding transcriptional MocR family regulator